MLVNVLFSCRTGEAAEPGTSMLPSDDRLRLKFTLELHKMVTAFQRSFAASGATSSWWAEVLEGFLALTDSEYGFIGEIHSDASGPFLKTTAITDISWDEETRRLYEEAEASGMVFRNTNTLFGRVLVERKTLVSNNVATDNRAGGRPKGHPPLRCFLGLACGDNVSAMVGLANRPGGYSAELIEDLEAIGAFIDSIVRHSQASADRDVVEARLQALVTSILDAVIMVSENGTILSVNPATEHIFGWSEDECLGENVRMLMPQPHRDAHDSYLQRFVRTGERRIIGKPRKLQALRKDGVTIWIELFVAEVEGIANRCFSGVVRDITEQVVKEKQLELAAAQLSTALEMANAGHWEYDVASDRFTFNDAFYKIFGATAAEQGGYQLSAEAYATRFVHPEEQAVVQSEIGMALNSAEGVYDRVLEHRFLYSDGRTGHLSVRVNVARDDSGAVMRLYGVVQDITERRAQEQARARLAEQARMNAELELRIEELDQNQQVSALTAECVGLLQRCSSLDEGIELLQRFVFKMFPNAWVSIYAPIDADIDDLLLIGARHPEGEFSPAPHIEGSQCWSLRTRRVYASSLDSIHTRCSHHASVSKRWALCGPLMSLDKVVGLVCLEVEPVAAERAVRERRFDRLRSLFESTIQSLGGALSTVALKESLQKLALVDDLTGLPNRRAFAIAARRGLARSKRSGAAFAIAVLDLDHFKAVNDQFGHDQGDRTLKKAARIMTAHFREADIVGRVGGEEFGVFLAGLDRDAAAERLHDLRERFENECFVGGQPVTVSVGFVIGDGSDEQDLGDYLRHADIALYAAKSKGRNTVVCSDEGA